MAFVMSSQTAVAAVKQFTNTGRASKISLLREIGIGTVLGIAAGMVWKVRWTQMPDAAWVPVSQWDCITLFACFEAVVVQ